MEVNCPHFFSLFVHKIRSREVFFFIFFFRWLSIRSNYIYSTYSFHIIHDMDFINMSIIFSPLSSIRKQFFPVYKRYSKIFKWKISLKMKLFFIETISRRKEQHIFAIELIKERSVALFDKVKQSRVIKIPNKANVFIQYWDWLSLRRCALNTVMRKLNISPFIYTMPHYERF